MSDGNLAGKADIQDFIKLALLILTHCNQTFNFTHGGWYAWSGLELHKYENKPDSNDVDKMKGDLRWFWRQWQANVKISSIKPLINTINSGIANQTYFIAQFEIGSSLRNLTYTKDEFECLLFNMASAYNLEYEPAEEAFSRIESLVKRIV